MSDDSYAQIPAGRYVGRARQAMALGNASNGNLRIAVTYDLLNDGFTDRSVTWFGSFVSPEAEDISIRTLRDSGWAGADFDDVTGLGDRDVSVVIKYRDYQGKQQLDVSVWPLGGSAFAFKEAAPKGAIKALSARLKGKLVASKPIAPVAKPAAFRPPQPSAQAAEWDGTGPDPDELPY